MHSKLTTIVTSLSVSPALLFSAMKYEGRPTTTQKAPAEEACDEKSPRTQRIEVKHIEANGVGYNEGYSTLEGFFTVPSTLDGSWVPFLDIRGHIFNDGKPAANGGMGLRYLTDTRIWGLNTYYDYRKTHRAHFNQVGFGFETLGKIWDFRVNAYVPVGKKDSYLYHTHFHGFKHHSIILSSRKEIAMKGANAEVAAHALRKENYKLYTAAGPYYFEHEGRVAWGGEGRIALTLFDYLRLQLSGSYDKIFRGIVQGEAAFTFSFGGKRTIKPRDNNCAQRSMVEERALQRVDRNEMVVVTRKRHKSRAINPETGHAYKVWFVDNTSHSQGTFESPFNTLVDAQNSSGPNDIIYVYPGDGDYVLTQPLVLQKGQQLLGAGFDYRLSTQLGHVTVERQAKGYPVITSFQPEGPNAVIVNLTSGNNVVSGLNLIMNKAYINNFNAGSISIMGGENYLISNNILTANGDGSAGLGILAPSSVTVVNNTFNSASNNLNFGIFSKFSGGKLLVKDNLFTGINANTGLAFGLLIRDAASELSVSVLNNTFNSQSNISSGANMPEAIFIGVGESSNIFATLKENQVTMPAGLIDQLAGIQLEVNTQATGTLSATLIKNTSITVSPAPGYYITNLTSPFNPAQLQVQLIDNVGTVTYLP